MIYKYAENSNYENYASGRVIYHRTGRPNYPVRLASEVFQRCYGYVDKDKVTIYDPCCGGAYMLTVLGLLHPDKLLRIMGSDIDPEAIEMANSNLRLLTTEGLDLRANQLNDMIDTYNRESHREALRSLSYFRNSVSMRNAGIDTETFLLDIFDLTKLPVLNDIDVIFTDVPYGNLVEWNDSTGNGVSVLLDSLFELSGKNTVVALSMNKAQKLTSEVYSKFKRLEKFNVGKRKIEILRKRL